MTSNAYLEPNMDGWYNLTDEWDIVRRPTSPVAYFRG
jgi:putative lipase involved disintegration of autophagic bodies